MLAAGRRDGRLGPKHGKPCAAGHSLVLLRLLAHGASSRPDPAEGTRGTCKSLCRLQALKGVIS